MKTSELNVGEMYETKDGNCVLIVDTSLTWHKNTDDQYEVRYGRRRRKRWNMPEPTLYQVTDKRQLEKYARGGIGVLSMEAMTAYRQQTQGGSSSQWVPDVRSPQSFKGPWQSYIDGRLEEERLDREKKERARLIAERTRQSEQRIEQIHRERFNIVAGMVDQLVADQALEDVKLPAYISFHSSSAGRNNEAMHVLLTDEFFVLPQAWAEPILELVLKTDLWRRLAGVDE